MDYQHFFGVYREKMHEKYSDRTVELHVLRRFLEGTMYDVLPYPFVRTQSGDQLFQPNLNDPTQIDQIPISERRPSVIFTLAGTVVEDSVSFLFGEGRFPRIKCLDPVTKKTDELTEKTLEDLIQKTLLPAAMLETATMGSIGSAALLIKVLNSEIYYESLKTEYLTPIFNRNNPMELISLIQKYLVEGEVLITQGYNIQKPHEKYWLKRVWTTMTEDWYIPYAENAEDNKNFSPIIDKERSVQHGLGIVPVVWIKNLEGGNGIDGHSTFFKGMTTNIQLDYQASQCGRGLTYSQEPLLFYKMDANALPGENAMPIGTVLVGGENSDAKFLEISGEGITAAMAYQEFLRKIVLENIHGNRSSPDKVSMHTTSGRALEMFHYPVIQLADRLRHSYGQNGLVRILKMIVKIISKKEIKIDGKIVTADQYNESASIELMWQDWFELTESDKQLQSTALGELKNSGIISQETAVRNVAKVYRISNVPQEIKTINTEMEKMIQEEKPKVTETIKS